MGDLSVGKTSIITAFIEGKEQRTKKHTPFVSDYCRIVEVNEGGQKHSVKLNIWDAAGDNKVH